jgi:hypothetical protein
VRSISHGTSSSFISKPRFGNSLNFRLRYHPSAAEFHRINLAGGD